MPTPLPAAATYGAAFLDAIQRSRPSTNRRGSAVWTAFADGLAKMIVRSDEVAVKTYQDHTPDAQGAALDEFLAARRVPFSRFDASKARGVLTLARQTTGAGAGYVPAGYEVRVAYKGKSVTFTTLANRVVGSTDTLVDCDVEASVAGVDSNIGTASTGVEATGQPAPLFDTTLKPLQLTGAGGSPAETDAELVHRYQLWQRARKGGLAASIAFGALSVNGVKRVALASFRDEHFGSMGAVYVGDQGFNGNDTLVKAVTPALESWRAFGPALPVRPMRGSDLSITATAYMARDLTRYNELAIVEAMRREVIAYFASRPDPYSYDLSTISGRIARGHDEIVRVSIASPTTSWLSRIGPAYLLTQGLPALLQCWRTDASLLNFTLAGPQ